MVIDCRTREDVRARISVVIPARNEEERLPRLLDSRDQARGRYPGEVEVIVSDNSSTDGTVAIAHSRGCAVVTSVMRRIASVRNAGASVTSPHVSLHSSR